MHIVHTKNHKTNKRQHGFTLIELLAVMFVFSAISALVIAILTSVLRGNNKTNALNLIQQNGTYAIDQMSKSIRNASTLLAPFPCGAVDAPTATSAVRLAFPDGSVSTYSCLDTNGNPAVTSNSATLVDTSSVKVTSCSFTCGQDSPSSYPIIGINFYLQSKNSSGFIDQQASASAIQFQTSVIIRNLIR